MTDRKRIVWVDAYKAYLIALVVLGHSFQNVVTDFDGNIFVKCIYSHHMAAFFLLSGFVTWRPEFRFSALWRKLGDLLVPFFLWWLIAFARGGCHDLIRSLCALLRNPDAGLWFLYVLAVCHAFNFMVRGLCVRLRFNADIGLLLAMGGLMGVEVVTGWNHYGFHFIAWYNIFYTLGYWARKYINHNPQFSISDGIGPLVHCNAKMRSQIEQSKNRTIRTLLLMLAWAVMIPCWSRNAAITLPFVGTLPTAVAFGYRFLSVVLAVGWEVLLFSRCTRLPRVVELLGRNTLGIYAIHGLLLATLAPIAKPLGPYAAIPLLFAVTLPLATVLVVGLRRLPFVGRWLVGR